MTHRMRMKNLIVAAIVAAPALVVACGPSVPTVTVGSTKSLPKASASTSGKAGPPRPPLVPSTSLGAFGAGTFGPRVVRGPKGTIVVSAQRSSSGRRWIAQALDASGTPRPDAQHEVAEAPEDRTSWDIQPIEGGFLLAWTRATDAGHQVLTVALAADGAVLGTPNIVARGGEDLLAVTLVPMGGSPAALLTFGEQSTAKGTTIPVGTLFALPIDGSGRAIGTAPTIVGERLAAWQVSPLGDGTACVGVVERNLKTATGAPADEVLRSVKIAILGAGAKGVTVSDFVNLTPNETALPDVRVIARGPGKLLAAWEDGRDIDRHVYAQAIDVAFGKPKPKGSPVRAAPPRGDQSMTALVSTSTGPVLVWEVFHPRSLNEPRRRFEMVRLGETGEPAGKARAFFFPYEEQAPEVATVNGSDEIAVLTYGEACLDLMTNAAPSCNGIRPWLLRFAGPTLVPVTADLLDVGDLTGGPALHAFDLSCNAKTCEALVDGPGDPATVAMAHVGHDPPPVTNARWVYVELAEPPATPPRLENATAVGHESSFAGLRVVRTTMKGSVATLAAWITDASDDDVEAATPVVEEKNDKSDGKDDKGKKKKAKKKAKSKKGDGGAKVAVRLLDGAGEPLGPVTVMSERALSKGDIAVAAGANEKDGAVVAYVSRAEGDEEVYVARLDGNGKKTGKSSRITHAEGSASDVALVALPDGGYVVGWVDGRKDTMAVYAVKLDKGGAKVGTEVKIGGGIGGDVSDLALAYNGTGSGGPRILAAWSDARDDLNTGFGDVYFTVFSGKDVDKTLVPERPIAKTKLHSHTPSVATRTDGTAVIAWMEDDPQSTSLMELIGKPDWGAYVARIDSSGATLQGATLVPFGEGVPSGVVSGVAVDCAPVAGVPSTTCRLGLALSERNGITMLATTMTAAAPLPARLVWAYAGAPTQETSPAFAGNALYLCEDGLEKDDGRVRRLSLAW